MDEPREDDHLVEPLFAAIRAPRDDGDAAPPSTPRTEGEAQRRLLRSAVLLLTLAAAAVGIALVLQAG
jgi:hypothetical protein